MRGNAAPSLRRPVLLALALLALLALAVFAAPAGAAPPTGDGSGGVVLTHLGSFERPIYADNAPGTKGTLYVVESEGVIRVLQGNTVRAKPFLDISDLVQCCGEEGLLSMAFHPGYRRNGLFYVYFDNNAGDLVVMEFRRKKNPKKRFVAMRSSGRQVLYIPHPVNANHNGGTIAFGPDGYLYIAPGEAGNGVNAQDDESLLGKMLRIDPRKTCVDFVKKSKRCAKSGWRPYGIPKSNPFVGLPGRDEIYAKGFRNPFRFSFDSLTGAISIGDVGQSCREEIDYRLAGNARGVNFGWPRFEGTRLNQSGQDAPNAVFPIYEYDNTNGAASCPPLNGAFDGVSVIAGFVVRDPRLTHQYGRLLYSDAARPDLRSLIPSQGGASDDQSTGIPIPGSPFGFAEGYKNRLYVVSGDGPVWRIDP
jgi:hypothetical protein